MKDIIINHSCILHSVLVFSLVYFPILSTYYFFILLAFKAETFLCCYTDLILMTL